MKTQFLLLIFAFSLFILVDGAIAECADTDAGLDYYTFGSCDIFGFEFEDYCLDEYNLAEYSCMEGIVDMCGVSVHECPASCEDGACIQGCVSDGSRIGCHQFDTTDKEICERHFVYTSEKFKDEPRNEDWPQQCKWNKRQNSDEYNCWAYGGSIKCEEEIMQHKDMCQLQPGCIWTLDDPPGECWEYDNDQVSCEIKDGCVWMEDQYLTCMPDYSENCWQYFDVEDCEANGCWWFSKTWGTFCANLLDQCWLEENCEDNPLCYVVNTVEDYTICDSYCSQITNAEECVGDCVWETGWCQVEGCWMYGDEQACITKNCYWREDWSICVENGCHNYDNEESCRLNNCMWSYNFCSEKDCFYYENEEDCLSDPFNVPHECIWTGDFCTINW